MTTIRRPQPGKLMSLLMAALGLFGGSGALRVARAAQPQRNRVDPGCCNVVELRQYTLKAGRREAFVSLFDSTFADPLDATGMTVIGQFRDLDRPDRFVWIRGFQDMPARALELGAFYDGELWLSHRDEANASIDDSDNVLLLEPAAPALRFKDIPERSSTAGDQAPTGLIVVTIYYLKPDAMADFASLFDRLLRSKTRHAGARTLSAYVTSSKENNFPRLPVRRGEQAYVWVARFANPVAYDAYLRRLAHDSRWTGTLWPQARRLLVTEPEVLRLVATSRSRLR